MSVNPKSQNACAPCAAGYHGKCRDERAGGGSGMKGWRCGCCFPEGTLSTVEALAEARRPAGLAARQKLDTLPGPAEIELEVLARRLEAFREHCVLKLREECGGFEGEAARGCVAAIDVRAWLADATTPSGAAANESWPASVRADFADTGPRRGEYEEALSRGGK